MRCVRVLHRSLSRRFYGRHSSYVHGGLDSSGKLTEAVYGQAVGVALPLSLPVPIWLVS